MSKNISKNISKNLNSKYSPFWSFQKTEEATSDLIGNKIAYRIKSLKNSQQNN